MKPIVVHFSLGRGDPATQYTVESEIYKELILNRLSINKGMFFENSVAQQLRASGHKLIFNRFEKEGKNYEIDFLLSRNNKLHPIEVKSASYRSHKSLDEFRKKYGSIIGDCYVIHSNDLGYENGIIYVPIYMTMFL